MENIVKIVSQLLVIREHLRQNCKHPEKYSESNYELESFSQVWPDTSCGFGGIGGQMITTEQTHVFFPLVDDEDCQVYVGYKFAYTVAPDNQKFLEDVKNHNVAGLIASGRYRDN